MRAYLQEACLANLSHLPSLIWERVMASLREAHPDDALNTIPRLPSISIIKYTRAQATGSDAFRAIESVPTRNVAEDDRRPFLQFNVVHIVGCGQHRYVGFGHPDLVRLLRYSSSAIFIDGTFKMAPRPFTQCLIVMVKDPGVNVYVPAMYVLMTSKQQDAYWNALNYVIVQTDRQCNGVLQQVGYNVATCYMEGSRTLGVRHTNGYTLQTTGLYAFRFPIGR
ncbi:hypothetical protein Pcac1_g22858 [Phytophthora cactorum]|nr:hypothetical protein Pcac1_g22858 [Phytophthora cactorum]